MMNDILWKEVRFFNKKEFDSKSTDGVDTGDNMHPRLIFALDAMRGLLGKSLSINSGFRTKSHNASVGGAPSSAHLTGEAADVNWLTLTKEDRAWIVKNARKLGFTGIGIAKGFVHLDIKPRVASWRYVAKGQVSVPVGKEEEWV